MLILSVISYYLLGKKDRKAFMRFMRSGTGMAVGAGVLALVLFYAAKGASSSSPSTLKPLSEPSATQANITKFWDAYNEAADELSGSDVYVKLPSTKYDYGAKTGIPMMAGMPMSIFRNMVAELNSARDTLGLEPMEV